MINPVEHDTALAALYETRWNLLRTEVQVERWIEREQERPSFDHQARITRLYVERDSIVQRLETNGREVYALNAQYTGWSRFFLVTSSQGHVHSSMACTTCRPTTEYGWLPELSGQTEDEAVKALGPNLCTVCFSSAPVETVGGKISKRIAQDMAWSSDREARIARREKDAQAKVERAAKKAANALKYAERIAPKIDAIITAYGWGVDYYKIDWDAYGYQAVVAFEDIQREHARNERRAA